MEKLERQLTVTLYRADDEDESLRIEVVGEEKDWFKFDLVLALMSMLPREEVMSLVESCPSPVLGFTGMKV